MIYGNDCFICSFSFDFLLHFAYFLFIESRGGVFVLFFLWGLARLLLPMGQGKGISSSGVCKLMVVTQGENQRYSQPGMAFVSSLRDFAISGRQQVTGALSFYIYVALEGPGRASARMVIWYWGHVRQAIIAFHSSPMYVNSSPDPGRGVNGRNIAPIPLLLLPFEFSSSTVESDDGSRSEIPSLVTKLIFRSVFAFVRSCIQDLVSFTD